MKARIKVIAFSVAMVAVLASGLAWACTEAAGISLGANGGPAGLPVSITGTAFAPEPVEIRWNSAEGPILGTAQGPDFTVEITPPSGTRSDVYYVVAVQNSSQGNFKATETFSVTGAAGPSTSVSTDLWSGFSGKASSSEMSQTQDSSPDYAPVGAALMVVGGIAMGGLALAMPGRRKAHSG